MFFSSGLLLPKVVEDRGMKRTDIGNLGSGIYFSDSIRSVPYLFNYIIYTRHQGDMTNTCCEFSPSFHLSLLGEDFSPRTDN